MRFTLFAAVVLFFCSCAPPPVRQPQRNQTRPPLTRLLFGGDVMFSRAVRREILQARDPALPFRKIAPLMAAADITFVNLESPFSDAGPYHENGLIFHAPPETIAGLNLAGVAIASTANNHARDCGPHGVEFTITWLRAHRIQPLGSSNSEAETHRGIILARNGIRFGFLGYTFDQSNGNWRDVDKRIAVADINSMSRDVASLATRADIVIVSMHHGIEYMPKPSRVQIAFAHAAIDHGARLVIGHHPHVIQRMEKYRNGLIFYSLGNLVFDQYQRAATQRGELAGVTFLGRDILAVHLMQVKITPTGPELENEQAVPAD